MILPDQMFLKLFDIFDELAIKFWAPQVALVVKNLFANAGEVRDLGSLGREDPLEEGMATHTSILARRIPWTEEPGRLQSMGSQRVGQD